MLEQNKRLPGSTSICGGPVPAYRLAQRSIEIARHKCSSCRMTSAQADENLTPQWDNQLFSSSWALSQKFDLFRVHNN